MCNTLRMPYHTISCSEWQHIWEILKIISYILPFTTKQFWFSPQAVHWNLTWLNLFRWFSNSLSSCVVLRPFVFHTFFPEVKNKWWDWMKCTKVLTQSQQKVLYKKGSTLAQIQILGIKACVFNLFSVYSRPDRGCGNV